MTEHFFSAESSAVGLLKFRPSSSSEIEIPSRRLSPTSQLLAQGLALFPRESFSQRFGIYVILDGERVADTASRQRPFDFFKNMPGLAGPLALHEAELLPHNGPTFTFLDSQFGFLHAIDQLLFDFSTQRVDSGLLLFAHLQSPAYAFAVHTWSRNWLENVRPAFLQSFSDPADELIRRFQLLPQKVEAPS